jgi:ribosome-associated toxin RatA of RatAB toxin-antitoxin module
LDFYPSCSSALTINEKDRHVLAAAIVGKAEVIVTFDLKHFGSEHLEPWGVRAHHPQVFLQSLWGFDPVGVTSRLATISHFRGRPPEHVSRTLNATVPKFVSEIAP